MVSSRVRRHQPPTETTAEATSGRSAAAADTRNPDRSKPTSTGRVSPRAAAISGMTGQIREASARVVGDCPCPGSSTEYERQAVDVPAATSAKLSAQNPGAWNINVSAPLPPKSTTDMSPIAVETVRRRSCSPIRFSIGERVADLTPPPPHATSVSILLTAGEAPSTTPMSSTSCSVSIRSKAAAQVRGPKGQE